MSKKIKSKATKTKNLKNNFNRNIIIITILLLFLISISTKYFGSTDIGDYADTAKFFSGIHPAKLRASHSIVYGLMHAPFVKLTQSLIFFKISSVLWLSLLILSVYYISNKNRKTLLLFITTPIIWYMAPWINPVQLSGLLFLWAYYFIKKYEDKDRLKYLIYSGLLAGLSWAFWDGVIYFAIIFAFCFLYNKKTSHFIYFIIALFIGTSPKLIIDQIFFGFAFFSIFKHFAAIVSSHLYGGVYSAESMYNPLETVFVLLIIPFYSFLLFSKKIFQKPENKKTIIFLFLSLLIIIFNVSQVRYLTMIIPIIILLLGENLNDKQFKIQISIFLIISLLVINPYIIQIKYDINGKELNTFISNFPNLKLSSTSVKYSEVERNLVSQDLINIAKEYPNENFVVGDRRDNFQPLARLYWGSDIKELISIQDYRLFLEDDATIASKKLCSSSMEWNRRDVCMEIELRKTINDKTDYESIKYAISLEGNLDLEGFEFVKKYQRLSLYEKTDIKNTINI